MNTDAFTPKDLPEHVQQFLFACAFWIMAADEELSSTEQAWLVKEFGEQALDQRLNHMLSLPDGQFLPTFDQLTTALTDNEKRIIYPPLTRWLCECVTADGQLRPAENEVMRAIQDRIKLRAETERLGQSETSPAAPEVVDSVQPVPPPMPAPPPMPPAADIEPPPEIEPEEEVVAELVETGEPQAEELPEVSIPEAPAAQPEPGAFTSLTGHQAEVTTVTAHPNDNFAASGDKDGVVMIWDIDKEEQKKSIQAHDKEVSGLSFLPDGSALVTADRSGNLACWTLDSGEARWHAELKSIGGISGIAVSPKGDLVAVSSPGCRIVLIDAKDGAVKATWREKGWSAFRCIAYSPDGKIIGVGADDRSLRLLDAKSGKQKAILAEHEGTVLSLAFSKDGSKIVAGCRDNELYVWDLKTRKLLNRLVGHTFSVYGVAFSADGARILSASWDHTAKVWDVQSGQPILNYENPDGSFNAVDFLDHAATAIAACSDKNVYVIRL